MLRSCSFLVALFIIPHMENFWVCWDKILKCDNHWAAFFCGAFDNKGVGVGTARRLLTWSPRVNVRALNETTPVEAKEKYSPLVVLSVINLTNMTSLSHTPVFSSKRVDRLSLQVVSCISVIVSAKSHGWSRVCTRNSDVKTHSPVSTVSFNYRTWLHHDLRSKRTNGMKWYGMVWHGMVWYGMVWYGMVWYGMVWYGMVWYGMVWHDIVWYRPYSKMAAILIFFCLYLN